MCGVGVEAEVKKDLTRPFLQAGMHITHRMPETCHRREIRTHVRFLFQAKLTDGSQDSSEYMVAVPALKQLAALGSIELLDFLKLLSMNEDLLNTLVKCDIVSTAAGIVRFQSRAAKWYAESLPAASSQRR